MNGETIENILFKAGTKTGHLMNVVPERVAISAGASLKELQIKLSRQDVPAKIAGIVLAIGV